METIDNDNLELRRAWEFVEHTGVSLFLTGKAGTGKTTFLRRVRQLTAKTSIVVAPTGVAAINAGGVTIHSFFQLPLAPFLPGSDIKEKFNFSRDKLRIIRTLDLLIIDEISMVRADLLDAIDFTLRKYRRDSRPFGGVQLMMIGDLQQLAPVVTDADQALLGPHYHTPYFFGSKALAQLPYVTVQLQKVYRQQSGHFLNLLNHLRDDRLTPADWDALRSRLFPGFVPKDSDGYIRLTSHNAMADSYNDSRLGALKGSAQVYDAEVNGTFPESSFPTAQHLRLKVGTQVMFIKNDPEGRYYNGKIGTVTEATDCSVTVRCTEDASEVEVEPQQWENAKYSVDPATNTITTSVQGTFSQLPLRLAWAITIHKSQGLTFDKVVIDAGASFAPGQVYVALSRCTSLEGIVLTSPLENATLHADANVLTYVAGQDAQAALSIQRLPQIREDYHRDMLCEMFNFRDIVTLQSQIQHILSTTFRVRFPSDCQLHQQLAASLREKIVDVADRWTALIRSTPFTDLVAPPFQDRIRRSASYFHDSLAQLLTTEVIQRLHRLGSDNKNATQRLATLVTDLTTALLGRQGLLEAMAQTDFSVPAYLKTKQQAWLDASMSPAELLKRQRLKLKEQQKANRAAKAASKPPKAPKESTFNVTLRLFRQGLDRKSIARERGLTLTTITGHLLRHAEASRLSLTEIFGPEILAMVHLAIDRIPPETSYEDSLPLLPTGLSYSDYRYIRNFLASHPD